MPLATQDLSDIRNVILEALDVGVNPRLDAQESEQKETNNRLSLIEDRVQGVESAQQETNHRLTVVETSLADVNSRIAALHNDVIELYKMVGKLQHRAITDAKFQKFPADKKLLAIHAEIVAMAQELNIPLPKE